MFTPSPYDPLVEESKANSDPDCYQIVLPNELILNIALLKDFNRFRFKDFSSGITEDDDIDRMSVKYAVICYLQIRMNLLFQFLTICFISRRTTEKKYKGRIRLTASVSKVSFGKTDRRTNTTQRTNHFIWRTRFRTSILVHYSQP